MLDILGNWTNHDSSGSNRLFLPLLAGIILVLTTSQSFAFYDIFAQVRRIRAIDTWTITYAYSHDTESSYKASDLYGESRLKLDSSGNATFTRKGRGTFQGKGRATYDYSSYSKSGGLVWEGQTEDQYIEHWGDGKGSGPIFDEGTELTFDFDSFTYSFNIYISEEDGEGVPVRVGMRSNIEHPNQKEMLEFINKTADFNTAEAKRQGVAPLGKYSEQIRDLANLTDQAMREALNPGEEEGSEAFSFGVAAIPIPFFGTDLCGSQTIYDGAIITWCIQPLVTSGAEGTEQSSSSWVHYHPASHEDYVGFKSSWPDVIQNIVDANNKAKAGAGGVEDDASLRVFLIDLTGAQGEGRTLSCGGRSTPVELTGEGAEVAESSLQEIASRSHAERASTEISPEGRQMAAQTDVHAALTALFFSEEAQTKEGLLNTVQDHPLLLDRLLLQGSSAIVEMSGLFEPRDSCDRERVETQIKETLLQFDQVAGVVIRLNGRDF